MDLGQRVRVLGRQLHGFHRCLEMMLLQLRLQPKNTIRHSLSLISHTREPEISRRQTLAASMRILASASTISSISA